MNKKQENKQENKKFRWKFALLMAGALVFGGCLGFFMIHFEGGLQALAAGASRLFHWAMVHILPWGCLASALILLMVYFPLYRKAKKLFAAWNQEEETTPEKVDSLLDRYLFLESVMQIFCFFCFGCTTLSSRQLMEAGSWLTFWGSILGLFATLIVITMTQRRVIDLIKEMSPEKHGSTFDMKFNQVWLNSCDEAEKLMIYKAAYHSYKVTTYTCLVLWMILAIGAMVVPMSVLALICVSLVWLMSTVSYMHKARQLSRAGTKITLP